MKLVVSVSGEVRVLKKYGCGKKTNSVFEGFFPLKMYISMSNQVKWSERRVVTLSMLFLDSNKNSTSST